MTIKSKIYEITQNQKNYNFIIKSNQSFLFNQAYDLSLIELAFIIKMRLLLGMRPFIRLGLSLKRRKQLYKKRKRILYLKDIFKIYKNKHIILPYENKNKPKKYRFDRYIKYFYIKNSFFLKNDILNSFFFFPFYNGNIRELFINYFLKENNIKNIKVEQPRSLLLKDFMIKILEIYYFKKGKDLHLISNSFLFLKNGNKIQNTVQYNHNKPSLFSKNKRHNYHYLVQVYKKNILLYKNMISYNNNLLYNLFYDFKNKQTNILLQAYLVNLKIFINKI